MTNIQSSLSHEFIIPFEEVFIVNFYLKSGLKLKIKNATQNLWIATQNEKCVAVFATQEKILKSNAESVQNMYLTFSIRFRAEHFHTRHCPHSFVRTMNVYVIMATIKEIR